MRFLVVPALAIVVLAVPAVAQEKTVAQDVVSRFARAWDGGDAKAIGVLFAPDADLITPDGLVVVGQADIVRYYAAAFSAGYGGSHGTGQALQERVLGPGLTLLDGRFTISGLRDKAGVSQRPQSGMVSLVVRSDGGGWQIVAWRERGGSGFSRFARPGR